MDYNLVITTGIAIAGIGIGVFFRELFNSLTSKDLKEKIKELEKDKEQLHEKLDNQEDKYEKRLILREKRYEKEFDDQKKKHEKELKPHIKLKKKLQKEVAKLQQMITDQKSTLNETQKYLWNLLNGTLKNAVINTPLSIDLMRNLKLAFDYLIIEKLEKITTVSTFPYTGIGRHEWTALENAGFFKLVNHQDYVLTKEGKDIFDHYKAANPRLEK